MMKKRSKRALCAVIAAAAGATVALCHVLNKREKEEFNNEPEPENGEGRVRRTFYEKYIKRTLDITISCLGLIFIAPVIAVSSAVVFLEDPGHVIFRQKRVGRHKSYFYIHKLRSMKQNCPDIPTHLMENPEQYILKSGKIFRKFSIDELPQLIDIIRGKMSLVGPRPALWNQDDLVAERDQYGANDVMPGLTGWAQINGRDELEIPVKAKLDGEYVKALKKSSLSGFIMDCRCLLGTVTSVLHHEGVVEGGTGELHKEEQQNADRGISGSEPTDPDSGIGFGKPVTVNTSATKKVLITGAGSYIGESFETYAKEHYGYHFAIDTLDMQDPGWRQKDFSGYDIVYHVAGLAHADVGKVSEETKQKYYAVNTDLAIETAEKAKAAGVKLFVFMSSMIVYGESAPFGKEKMITAETRPEPANFYGDSKWQADMGVRALADADFKVAVLRPPMIYGRGSKGNYPTLAKMAKKLPVFPDVENQRSMLYIENLCEFLSRMMLVDREEFSEKGNIFFPQNPEYTRTSEMVELIAKTAGHKIRVSKLLAPAVFLAGKVPGKIGALVNKAFGNSCYAQEMSSYEGLDYQRTTLEESIVRTEGTPQGNRAGKEQRKKHILVISQYFYPEEFRINDMCKEWVKRGYRVTVLTGIPNYPQGRFYDGYGYHTNRTQQWAGMDIIRIPLIPRGNNAIGMIANYLSFAIAGYVWVRKTRLKADMVFTFEVSPMTQALIGCWYRKKYHVPAYLYVQDLWPENVEVVTGITNPVIIKPIDRMVDYIYQHTDEIFATSPSFVDAICNRKHPVPREKVHYWPQYAEEFYRPVDKAYAKQTAAQYGIPNDGSFRVIFTGNIGTAQGLEILPRTAELLKDENIRFVLVGDGRYRKDFMDEIRRRQVETQFVMVPKQPAEKIPELLAACDVAFLSFADDDLWKKTIPAKLQSYMACGMPILASAEGETERIIREADSGICCPIGNADALAEKLREMMHAQRSQMGENARLYYEKHFEKQMLMDEMEKEIANI